MRYLLIALLATLLINNPTLATETAEEKRALITQVLEVTGEGRHGEQISEIFLHQITIALIQSNPDLPAESLTILQDELRAILHEELRIKQSLQALLFPVYYKYFSTDELLEIVRFYSTPTGRKANHVMPLMAQESIVVGQQWIRELAPTIRKRIIARLESEGIMVQ